MAEKKKAERVETQRVTVNSLEALNAAHQEEQMRQVQNRYAMLQKALSLTNNLSTETIGGMGRADMLRYLMDGPRDIDAECGYPAWLTPDHYRLMFDREGISKRVVACEPEETWAIDPELYEDEDPENKTEFEEAWDELLEQYNIWHHLQRIDVLSGIGQFGVILIGLDDGKELYEPVEGIEDDGSYTPQPPGRKILYLREFSEEVVFVKTRQTDPTNPRFGSPTMYTVQFRDFPNWGVQAGEVISRDVHWTRVLHVADNRKMSDVYGTPRMQPVYNRLYDIRKIASASGEGYWKGAFPGLAFEVNPELADQGVEIDAEGVRREFEKYANGLQRYLAVTGVTTKSLPPQVTDPTPSIKTHLLMIAVSMGIPYRILFGTEEAKLAGEQDSRAWNKRMAKRQAKYVTPMIIRPFVDRLVAYGVLPVPEEAYSVDWPDLGAPTDQDKATVAQTEAGAMQVYVQGGLTSLMTPKNFLVHVLKKTEDEAEAMLEGAEEYNADLEEAEQEKIDAQNEVEIEKAKAMGEAAGQASPGQQGPGGKPPFGKKPFGGGGGGRFGGGRGGFARNSKPAAKKSKGTQKTSKRT